MVKSKRAGYKRFDRAIKEKAFELLKAGHTGKAVARELGVSYPTIINWKRSSADDAGSTQEAAAGRDEVELLKLENDYLKKRMETDDELSRLKLEVEYLKKRLAVYER